MGVEDVSGSTYETYVFGNSVFNKTDMRWPPQILIYVDAKVFSGKVTLKICPVNLDRKIRLILRGTEKLVSWFFNVQGKSIASELFGDVWEALVDF